MKILVTGAAGNLGTAVRRELATAGHSLRLADIKPIEQPEGEALTLDVADAEAVLRAMDGMEAVAHLAFGGVGAYSEAESIRLNFDVNARGTYNLLWAACQHGVRRFVYTSTLTVFGDKGEMGKQVWTETTPPNPMGPYGFAKYCGEEACRMFARRSGLSVVVLRLCNLANDEQWRNNQAMVPANERDRHWRAMTTHVRDVARAVHLALTVPDLRFEIIHIAADNQGRRTEIQKAKDVLGFWPALRLDSFPSDSDS